MSIKHDVPVSLVGRAGHIGGGHIEAATPAGGDTTGRGWDTRVVTLVDGWTRPGSAPFTRGGGYLPGHALSAGPGRDPVVRQRAGEVFRRLRHVRSFTQSELEALLAGATLVALAKESRSSSGRGECIIIAAGAVAPPLF